MGPQVVELLTPFLLHLLDQGLARAIHREAKDEVIDWLTFYKHWRLHSTLGYISPMKFDENWHAGPPKKGA